MSRLLSVMAVVFVCTQMFILTACVGDAAGRPAPKAGGTTPLQALQEAHRLHAAAEVRAAIQGRTQRGIEDVILRLEQQFPGLGGISLDSTGTLVVYAKDTAQANRFAPGLIKILSQSPVQPHLRQRLTDSARTRIVPGDFAFSDLVAWQGEVSHLVGPNDGIVSLDADESTNRLHILVKDDAGQQTALRLATQAGVPSKALTITLAPNATRLSSLRGTWRPSGGGVQIVNQDGTRCTLGFNVTTSTGYTGFLTASHCAPGTGGSGSGVGTTMAQPATGFGVGTIQVNPAWTVTDPACGTYTVCAYADAMFVVYGNPGTSQKRVAFTSFAGFSGAGGSITVTGWWTNVASPGLILVGGEAIDKMGRTTGWTRGTVAGTCENVLLAGAMTLCATRVVNARVGEGDSGSPVFIPPPSGQVTQPLYPAGLLFGGGDLTNYDASDGTHYCSTTCYYWFSLWSNIETHLGFTASP